MREKNFLKLIKLSVLIIGIIILNGCCTRPHIEEKIVYPRTFIFKDIPYYVWEDIPGYYGLDENKPYFDDIEEFFDYYEGLIIKVDDLLKLYE